MWSFETCKFRGKLQAPCFESRVLFEKPPLSLHFLATEHRASQTTPHQQTLSGESPRESM